MKKFLSGCLVLMVLIACNSEQKTEQSGADCLRIARGALLRGDYNRARFAIDSLRKHYPMAMNARELAILLLDSVELEAAKYQLMVSDKDRNDTMRFSRRELDSVQFEYEEALQKIKFYRHKLKHDQANVKIH